MREPEVIVIGAGPVGLAAGLLLEEYGVPAVILDRRTEPQPHPKARGVRLRASELLNIWGFDGDLRPLAMPDESHRFIYCESVAGREIARTDPAPVDSRSLGATQSYRVTQDALELAMERRLRRARLVELRRGSEVKSVTQDEDGVDVVVRDLDGSERRLRSRFVIAADGAASATRVGLGIRLGSEKPSGYWHSALWRADMAGLAGDRPAIVFYTQAGGDSLVGVGPAGNDGRWVTFVQLPPGLERPAPLTDAEAIRVTREALGRDDFPVELISTTTFRIGADVADSYRVSNVFLAGDASHVLPPTGGFGINTGFADIHNLVWKLAFHLAGEAPATLLETYESERRPVALSNIAWSEANRGRLLEMRRALRAGDQGRLQQLIDQQSDHVSPIGQDLAFSYAGAGGDLSVLTTATVGARAPHANIAAQFGEQSTIQRLFEGRVVVLCASAHSVDISHQVLERLGKRGVAIDISQLPDPDGHLRARYDAAFEGAIIIRPDGHIGWTTSSPLELNELTDALTEVLAQGVAPAAVDRDFAEVSPN